MAIDNMDEDLLATDRYFRKHDNVRIPISASVAIGTGTFQLMALTASGPIGWTAFLGQVAFVAARNGLATWALMGTAKELEARTKAFLKRRPVKTKLSSVPSGAKA